MKAVVIDRFGGSEEMYLTDLEKPVPGPDDVLVKNVYIGVGKPERLANIRNICMERIRNGQLTPRIFADLPLEEARHAHELMDNLQIMGKVILHI